MITPVGFRFVIPGPMGDIYREVLEVTKDNVRCTGDGWMYETNYPKDVLNKAFEDGHVVPEAEYLANLEDPIKVDDKFVEIIGSMAVRFWVTEDLGYRVKTSSADGTDRYTPKSVIRQLMASGDIRRLTD